MRVGRNRLFCANFVAAMMQTGQTGPGTASRDVNHPDKLDESARAAGQTGIGVDAGRVGDPCLNEPLSEGCSLKRWLIKILMQDSFI